MENKKWTKKYLVIIWLITLIVVICAIFTNVFKWSSFWFSGRAHGNVDINNYDFSKEKITDIAIDMNAADVNIQVGDEFSVETSFPEKYAPTVNLENGKLAITQKQNMKDLGGFDDLKLDIVVPGDAKLDTLKIDIAAGDVDIQDVKVDKLNLDANAGDIDINDIIADKVEVDANAGDINVMDATAKSIDVNVNAGDVDITGTFDKIDCDCDLGDIDIDAPNTDRSNIDVDCALGSVNVNAK